MAKTIVVTSGKGGVGKSSVSVNLAYSLCDKGYHVCLIDADFGLKNLDVMLGLENRTIYDMQDIVDGNCSVEQALIKDKRYSNLSLLPACKSLQFKEMDVEHLKNLINIIKLKYDYIIIDSPAGVEKGFSYAISLVKEAIVVVNLDIASLRDADRVVGLLMKEGIHHISMIINKVNNEDISSQRCLTIDDAIDILSLPVLGIVYEDHLMIEANNKGVPIFTNKQSIISQCFTNIVERMEGKSVPFVVPKKQGIIQRLLNFNTSIS